MINKEFKQNIDFDHLKEILSMSYSEQQEWLTNVLKNIQENNLETEFLAATENIFSESTIEGIKSWFNK